MVSAAGVRLAALLTALLTALASAQHGGGTNMPGGGIDLGALLGGGGAAGGKKQEVCKKGQVMVPKVDYIPAANGCGPTGMRQRDGDKWDLHECCNGHDTCYVRPRTAARVQIAQRLTRALGELAATGSMRRVVPAL